MLICFGSYINRHKNVQISDWQLFALYWHQCRVQIRLHCNAESTGYKERTERAPDATSDTLSILHFSPQNMVESLYVRWTYLIGDLQLGIIVFCVVLLLLDSTAHYQTMRFALPYTVRAKNSFWFVAYVWKVILIVCKSCFQCSNGIYWKLQKAACCTFLYWGLMWWN